MSKDNNCKKCTELNEKLGYKNYNEVPKDNYIARCDDCWDKILKKQD